MPDLGDQLRAEIRTLQAQRRSLESKLMQPQCMLSASLIERFLGASNSPRTSPAYYLIPQRAWPFEADLRQKGRPGHSAPALRRLSCLPAEPEGVAADYRHPGTALETVATGSVPIKHFYHSLSISLDIRRLRCQHTLDDGASRCGRASRG